MQIFRQKEERKGEDEDALKVSLDVQHLPSVAMQKDFIALADRCKAFRIFFKY